MKNTNQPNVWRNAAAILTGLLLIAMVVIYFLLDSVSEKDSTFKRDRLQSVAREAHLKSQVRLLDSARLAERHERETGDSLGRVKEKRLMSDLNASKKRERRSRADTMKLTIIDTVYAQYDTIILTAKAKMKADSASFEREIGILTQTNLKLDSANTGKFELTQSLYITLENQEKKISRLERISNALGISATALAVLVSY